jgi:hypothetical protein
MLVDILMTSFSLETVTGFSDGGGPYLFLSYWSTSMLMFLLIEVILPIESGFTAILSRFLRWLNCSW